MITMPKCCGWQAKSPVEAFQATALAELVELGARKQHPFGKLRPVNLFYRSGHWSQSAAGVTWFESPTLSVGLGDVLWKHLVSKNWLQFCESDAAIDDGD